MFETVVLVVLVLESIAALLAIVDHAMAIFDRLAARKRLKEGGYSE